MIKHVETMEELKAELAKGDVLLDFFATWCGPCKMLVPILEGHKSDIKVIKVDVDEFNNLAREYGVMSIPTLVLMENGVMSIPTLVLMENGKEVKRSIGLINEDELETFLE